MLIKGDFAQIHSLRRSNGIEIGTAQAIACDPFKMIARDGFAVCEPFRRRITKTVYKLLLFVDAAHHLEKTFWTDCLCVQGVVASHPAKKFMLCP